jgi:ABC-type ATPase with predicted acetyltransferase domain
MANEKQLIYVEPIKKFIVDRLNSKNAMEAFGYDAIEILEQIEFAHTVDAVEVVRCNDCKHFVQGEIYDPCECMKWTVKWGVAYVKPDDFCSYGERRNDG